MIRLVDNARGQPQDPPLDTFERAEVSRFAGRTSRADRQKWAAVKKRSSPGHYHFQ
jgi:hypothetical protein